jgi:hypothetical protein
MTTVSGARSSKKLLVVAAVGTCSIKPATDYATLLSVCHERRFLVRNLRCTRDEGGEVKANRISLNPQAAVAGVRGATHRADLAVLSTVM